MSYTQLSHDPLDLDPPSDVPMDDDIMISTPDQTHVYNTAAGQKQHQATSFYSSAQDPQYPHTPNSTTGSPHHASHNSSPQSAKQRSQSTIVAPIDPQRKSYPFSLVWGALPCISWIVPCIGHLGIADSRGEIHDFHGPYDVRLGKFMVGPVLRYYQLPQELIESLRIDAAGWDKAIYQSDLHYSGTVHNIVSNNCHHHVATAMTNVGMPSTMMKAWWLIMSKGKWVSGQRLVCNVLLPTIIFWGIIVGIILFFTKGPFT